MNKTRKITSRLMALVVAMSFVFSTFAANWQTVDKEVYATNSLIKKTDIAVKNDVSKYFDSNVVQKLPEAVSSSDRISVIVDMQTKTVMDAYELSDGQLEFKEYVLTTEAMNVANNVANRQSAYVRALKSAGVDFTMGEQYDTLIGGFEIEIKAGDFERVGKILNGANLIVGEEYEACKTEVVTNDVDVYETGIFDSSASAYQGDGVVVAVLDTGLDYTHSAFSADNFTTTTEALTYDMVDNMVKQTTASAFTSGLTGADVYVSKKVPYAYDYADKDPDVLPINSEHGTHVAGVIAGKADSYTDKDGNLVTDEYGNPIPFKGVAPNAQLAIMKVFSDSATGAKTSWILSALEDCVVLGVDVINMSLGSSCGFTREVDKEHVNAIYDRVREAGISLVTAASNDANSTSGSDKNGSNPLTTNPDSGTVGSPSTYEGALSVASVDGVKTPYLLFNGEILYFKEASASDGEDRDFVSEVLETVGDDVDSFEFDFVTIPGIGRSSDYPESGDFYAGKIVLVKRGTTTFEDKVRIAIKEKNAAGIIIYNNVSGDISMAIGDNSGAACSISQDLGEMLAAVGSGKLMISKDQVAGPFMSDFSSWGPTSDLRIKPEITAHGGEILSAVPGEGYARQSGTSMASPNQAGATALIRQHVKYSGIFDKDGELTPVEITDIVNQLMMSTTDIVKNKNDLPYAVRKQGAGLVNINKAQTTASYITTYDLNGNKMSKTKFELGDDKQRTGTYEMKFDINNVSGTTVAYDLSSVALTEGVSETYTNHDATTSTQDGYLLDGAVTTILSVDGGEWNGMSVTVDPNSSATVTVQISLSDTDKEYLEKSFKYGMYVEGFVMLDATMGTEVDISAPFLAYYGDWTEPPIFDEEYYDTHKDEINSGLDIVDKTMADAYATRVIGTFYSDYIAYLGTYYFKQDPATTQIAANKDYIALSNYENGESSTVNAIDAVWAGFLRNVKEAQIVITEDATGKVVFERTESNLSKSYSQGLTIYGSSVDIEFSALEQNLRNNTRYTVTITTFIDYGDYEDQKNVRNVFEFPVFVDYEAPVVTGVNYRAEYDKTSKKTRLYADVDIYDNHYAMAMQMGQILPEDYEETGYYFKMESFGKYATPVYSSFNSTSKVTVELTDYVAQLKNSVTGIYDASGNLSEIVKNNSYILTCYDYAMNVGQYEIRLPDEIYAMAFKEDTINLSPRQTKDLSQSLTVYPSDSWMQVLDFESSDPDVVDVVNQSLIAKSSGDAVITAIGYNAEGEEVRASVNVHVYAEGEKGYEGHYTVPSVNKFEVVGYTTNKAYYSENSDEREIGETGGSYDFGDSSSLSMYPSESVTLRYTLDSYYPEKASIKYTSGKSEVASVDKNGTIVAHAEGNTVITISFLFDGASTMYSKRINVAVKDPYTINSIYLMNYRGNGGVVEIPADRGLTHISTFAFSGYEYVPKDEAAGDVIDEEDPLTIKQSAIGENTITKVIIPEGVTNIEESAFEKLTALTEVVFPSTLVNIGANAFRGCTSLKTLTGLEHVKFINEQAFAGCAVSSVNLKSIVAIGNNAFDGCKISSIELPSTAQSLAASAFANNLSLKSVTFDAPKIKIGSGVFENCPALRSIEINAAVIPSYAFYGCSNLKDVKLGKDVTVIGEYAFAGTGVSKFTIDSNNANLTVENNGALVYNGDTLVVVAPTYRGTNGAVTLTATAIATGAFAGNANISSVIANNVTTVGAYAFAGCSALSTVSMNNLEVIGDHAFEGTALYATPSLAKVKSIGDYAFAGMLDGEGYILSNNITSVTIPDGATVGQYAFYFNLGLTDITVGENVILKDNAFYTEIALYAFEAIYESNPEFAEMYANYIFENFYEAYTYTVEDENGDPVSYEYLRYNMTAASYSALKTVTIGKNTVIGSSAFYGHTALTTINFADGVEIGDYAFYDACSLTTVNNFGGVTKVGAYAFSGDSFMDFQMGANALDYAYTYELIDGKLVATGNVYSCFAPAFATADLTNVVYLGEGAFANNEALTTVKFAESGVIDSIADYAFMNCTALSGVNIPTTVTKIGEYAFAISAISEIDLSNVTDIGANAFVSTELESVKLKAEANVGDGAFANCDKLSVVENLNLAKNIGANAFVGTAITVADISGAAYVGDFAFAGSKVTSVVFGESLVELGNNPFGGCEVTTFAKTEDVMFDGEKVGTTENGNYDISATVKVIDGVLYQVVPNGGLELISYPAANENESYVVADGTVKISEQAFAGAKLVNVTFPTSLKAIGDKAFFGCENLRMVVFTSYEAPMLEEVYDASYQTYDNSPMTGSLLEYEGLGIVPYYMWTITPPNYFYGANFVDYVGKVENKLVMVKPVNGQNYDNFVYTQYFDTVVEGNSAPTQATLDVIDMISALPENITLSHEALVESVRTAFDGLVYAQKSLVSNVEVLERAEATIKFLKLQINPDDGNGDEQITPDPTPAPDNGLDAGIIVLIVIASIVVVGGAAVTTWYVLKRKNNKI